MKSFLATLLASTAVHAATVTFWTLDDVERTVHFTPSPGYPAIDPVTVSNRAKRTVTFPDRYEGNFYAVPKDGPNQPGMLGEVAFGGWRGLTYFDVSAIVRPDDHNNVKQMWPLDAPPCGDNCGQGGGGGDGDATEPAKKQQQQQDDGGVVKTVAKSSTMTKSVKPRADDAVARIMSGCEVFPCNNAYWLPDDVQTKSTPSKHLMTTLGKGSTGLKFTV